MSAPSPGPFAVVPSGRRVYLTSPGADPADITAHLEHMRHQSARGRTQARVIVALAVLAPTAAAATLEPGWGRYWPAVAMGVCAAVIVHALDHVSPDEDPDPALLAPYVLDVAPHLRAAALAVTAGTPAHRALWDANAAELAVIDQSAAVGRARRARRGTDTRDLTVATAVLAGLERRLDELMPAVTTHLTTDPAPTAGTPARKDTAA